MTFNVFDERVRGKTYELFFLLEHVKYLKYEKKCVFFEIASIDAIVVILVSG
jgi:hypothetical protein